MYHLINTRSGDVVGCAYASITEAEAACRVLNVLRGRCIYRVVRI